MAEERKFGKKLYNLVGADNIDGVKRLIKLYGDELDINYISNDYLAITPLIRAIRHYNVDMVQILLKAGADANCTQTYYERTSPLHTAVCLNDSYMRFEDMPTLQTKERIEIVQLLLDAGADINAINAYDNTPLVIAVTIGFDKIVKLLLRYDPNITIGYYNGRTVMDIISEEDYLQKNRSAYSGDVGAIVKMLEEHIPPSQFIKSARKQ